MSYMIKPSIIARGVDSVFNLSATSQVGYQAGRRLRGYIEIRNADFPAIPRNAIIISAQLSFQQLHLSDLGSEMVGAWLTNSNWWESIPAASSMTRIVEFGQTKIPLGQRVGGTITSLLQDAIRTGDTKKIVIDTINNLNFDKFTWIEEIQIEVAYVIPPTITAPNGNTIKKIDSNGRFNINWTPAQVIGVDTGISDGKYALSYSPDYQASPTINGFTPLINAPESWDSSVIAYTHEFGNEQPSRAQGSQLAILFTFTTGGKLYRSDYSFSQRFIVDNNLPPTKPTNLIPNFNENRNISEPVVLMWKFNDPNVGDFQSKATIQYKKTSSSDWIERSINGNQTNVTIAAGALSIGTYEWQVKTWDAAGIESPWSDVAIFNASTIGNGPVLIEPGDYTRDVRPMVKWAEPQQVTVQIRLTEVDTPAAILWDSGALNTNLNERVINYDLIDGKTYIISVRVIRSNGVWSSWGTKTVIADFSQPSAPTLNAYPIEGGIRLVVSGDGTANRYFIYKSIGNSWIRIAEINPMDNNQFIDYAVANGKENLYRASSVTVAGNETTSNEVSGLIEFRGIYLHTVNKPSTMYLFKYDKPEREINKEVEHGYRHPVGRTKPTIEYGLMTHSSINANIQIMIESDDVESLDRLLMNRQEVCYRDERGRLMFGALTAVPLSDTFYGYTTAITITETDYSEAIE